MLLCKLNVFKRVLIRDLCLCNGSNPCISEDTYGKELSSSEQEKDIFDDDEDDTITVSG